MPEGTIDLRREDIGQLIDSAVDEVTPEPLTTRAREVAAILPATDSEGPGIAPGDRVGPYEVQEVLGAGGQAVVYRARHVHLDREVALKVPHKEVAPRLLREARLLARLDHPRIVRVEHVEPEGSLPHLVLEYCPGDSLSDLIERFPGGLPLARAREIASGVLEALIAADEAGVIHRDIKPSNVLFDTAGTAKVCDFGIGTVALIGSVEASLVTQGTLVAGTPLYMAPEQEDPSLAENGRLDGRTDLYAFGKLLFAMITGRKPRTFRPPSALREGLDPAWDAYVARLTEERPRDRFPDARAALAALRTLGDATKGAPDSAEARPWVSGRETLRELSGAWSADAMPEGPWWRVAAWLCARAWAAMTPRAILATMAIANLIAGWAGLAAAILKSPAIGPARNSSDPAWRALAQYHSEIGLAVAVWGLAAVAIAFWWGWRATRNPRCGRGFAFGLSFFLPLAFVGVALCSQPAITADSIRGVALSVFDPSPLFLGLVAGAPMLLVGLIGMVVTVRFGRPRPEPAAEGPDAPVETTPARAAAPPPPPVGAIDFNHAGSDSVRGWLWFLGFVHFVGVMGLISKGTHDGSGDPFLIAIGAAWLWGGLVALGLGVAIARQPRPSAVTAVVYNLAVPGLLCGLALVFGPIAFPESFAVGEWRVLTQLGFGVPMIAIGAIAIRLCVRAQRWDAAFWEARFDKTQTGNDT